MKKELLTESEVNEIISSTEDVALINTADQRLVFEGDYTEGHKMRLGPEEFEVDRTGYVMAARAAGIPQTYADKCPDSLINQNLNYWYGEGGLSAEKSFLRKGNKVVGVGNKMEKLVSNRKLLDVVSSVVDNVKGYHYCSNDLWYTTASVVSDKSFEAISDDILFGGIQLQSSILQKKPIEVSAYIYRQVCSNGACSSHELFKWSRKNSSVAIEDWIHTAAVQAYKSLDAEFNRIKLMTNVGIKGHASEYISSLLRNAGLSKGTEEEILQEVVNSGATSVYDVYNAISKVATHSKIFENNFISGRSLQMVAGRVSRHCEVCPTCHHIVR